jgi:mevalonate kinase
MWFKASAPGSLMLLGEYAVLENGYALVAAVNRRMSVKLIPRNDSKIKIISQLGNYETDLSQIEVRVPFQFVLTALKKAELKTGCDIIIESEFSDQMGFASSAAVTVATVSVLNAWLNLISSDEVVIRKSREIVREVQGIGSGADVAACTLGGVVAYRAEPFHVEKINYSHPITVVYSGSKTKTVDAIQHVKNYFQNQSELLIQIFREIDVCAQSGIVAAKKNNHHELGKIMNAQQKLMERLTVCTPALQFIIDNLQKNTDILGVKISGSGLGDCVVGLGDAKIGEDIVIAELGVICEKN